MGAFNRFGAIIASLREHQTNVRQRNEVLGCGLFSLLPLALSIIFFFQGEIGAFIFLGVIALLGLLAAAGGYSKVRPRAAFSQHWQSAIEDHSGAGELFDELIWFEANRQLADRTHPQLRELLDRAAASTQEIEKTSLEDEGLTEQCRTAARSAVVDIVWIGRHLFRRKRQRVKTFKKRCADPAYGAGALDRIGEIVQELETLAANMRGDAEHESPLREAMRRLAERHAAETELDQSEITLRR